MSLSGSDAIYKAIGLIREYGVPAPAPILIHPDDFLRMTHIYAQIEAKERKRQAQRKPTVHQRLAELARKKQR